MKCRTMLQSISLPERLTLNAATRVNSRSNIPTRAARCANLPYLINSAFMPAMILETRLQMSCITE